MCKTSLLLKTMITVLLFTLLVLRCGYDRSTEPESTPGYISYTLQWDSVIPGQPIPELIRYCIYPSEGGPMIQTDGDATGIKLCLPPDKYNILVFNYDARNIDFRHMENYEEAEAYLRCTDAEGILKGGFTPLYRVVVESVIISPGMESTQVITPVPIVQPALFADKVKAGLSTSLKMSESKTLPGTGDLLDSVLDQWFK